MEGLDGWVTTEGGGGGVAFTVGAGPPSAGSGFPTSISQRWPGWPCGGLIRTVAAGAGAGAAGAGVATGASGLALASGAAGAVGAAGGGVVVSASSLSPFWQPANTKAATREARIKCFIRIFN